MAINELFQRVELTNTYPKFDASNNINGKAIDMTIKFTGTIKVKKMDGTEVSVTFLSNVNTNIELHFVGMRISIRFYLVNFNLSFSKLSL